MRNGRYLSSDLRNDASDGVVFLGLRLSFKSFFDTHFNSETPSNYTTNTIKLYYKLVHNVRETLSICPRKTLILYQKLVHDVRETPSIYTRNTIKLYHKQI